MIGKLFLKTYDDISNGHVACNITLFTKFSIWIELKGNFIYKKIRFLVLNGISFFTILDVIDFTKHRYATGRLFELK